GTLDEAMETLTLLQTGKHLPLPLVLIEEPGNGTYWNRWHKFLKEELLEEGYINDTDFHLYDIVDSADEAVEKIKQFYKRYHSVRYIRGKLVIRLTSELDDAAIEDLSHNFADMLFPGGKICACLPLPEEEDEPDTLNLPRLIVDFNLMDFARLRALIAAINSY
ncbi:MAG: LOG family protein, partial [Nitrospiraceae bacterium]